ncbi:MAG: A/G-specific adenine glycosylase [Deltaproteobacteria bacterium]|nr:A/G-specific adenine glycosylase [Deltaproteobacteria bacterium]
MSKATFPTKKLLAWFRKNERDLPWRKDRRPYTVLVSEIMLQQTRVDQAEGYYRRFLESFPDISALARAQPERVLKAWEGLGYYSRARHLHQTARLIMKDYDGQIPGAYGQLLKLPGIGRSTAGAVLSLAYDQAYPIMDGNVKRVLARFFLIRGPIGQTETLKTLWQQAEAILPAKAPGRFNEALMELGALVCRPQNPDCARCPVREGCRAFPEGEAGSLPLKNPARKIPHYDVTAAVIRKGGQILITQRPEKGLLGGLWEFPGGKKEPGETLEACLQREIEEELGIAIAVGERFMQVRHAYSHFRITLHTFFCRHRKGRIQKIGIQDYRWVRPEELILYAFPRADRRVIEVLMGK